MQYIYTMKGLSRAYPPDAVVLRDIWLSFLPGAKIGVLGLNGAGKSSLLKIMAGEDTGFTGEAYAADGVSVGFLKQEPQLDPAKTVKGNVEEGVAEIKAMLDRFDELNMKLGEDLPPDQMDKVMEEQGRLQDRIDAANAWDIDSQLELAMDALRCPPPDADVATLSGGERRRVALCRLLLKSPDLLLLDEPTNHLDAESVAWLEKFLKDYKGTVVAVTHDRYFLDNAAEWILELDRGAGIPWKGNYSSWLDQKQQRLAQEEKSESKRQKTLQRELEWIRMAPRARQAKGKARLNAYEQMLNEDSAQKIEQVEIYIPPGPRLGDVVVEARGLRKAYGDQLLFDDLNFTLPRGGIVGVIGPNGAGKTTLFRMITGQEQPDAGTLRLGDTVALGYVDQSRDALSAEQVGVGGDHRRRRRAAGRQAADRLARLRQLVQLQGRPAAAQGGDAVGRRAEPRPPGQAAAARLEPAAAGRTDQRPRRGHAAGARRGAGQLRRLRGGDQPRPLVPGSHRHAHAGVRGREPGGVVRGQLPGLRGRPAAAPGRRGRPPPSHQVPQAHTVTARRRAREGTMNAEQAKFLAGYFAGLIEQETATTAKVLAAVPDDKRDYKPDPKSRTAWELTTHLATGDVWFLQSILDGKFEMDPAEAEKAAEAVLDRGPGGGASTSARCRRASRRCASCRPRS